ncbi:hypothetical protein [Dendronalium sp. ChiSLP03b]|uniref:hypothetical protein n=1 Tax=Dendronalium sp. ChiSLP03b TaxID=3075381 RepID=UPI002AD53BF3|nr:hypothetical protein [Dendronalium sp. ChiSLP03b]MDZ8204284.1 hypothetical protein [Dendronalium sp. ChiSLP03b]
MSTVEPLYMIHTALNRVQFPLCNWLEMKLKHIELELCRILAPLHVERRAIALVSQPNY